MFYVIDINFNKREILIFDEDSLDLTWEDYKDVSYYLRHGAEITNLDRYQIDYVINHTDCDIFPIRRGLRSTVYKYFSKEELEEIEVVEYSSFEYRHIRNKRLISDTYPCWIHVLDESKVRIQYYDYFFDFSFPQGNICNKCILNDKMFTASSSRNNFAYGFYIRQIGILKNGTFVLRLGDYTGTCTISINRNGGVSSRTFDMKAGEVIGKKLSFNASKKRLLLMRG